MLRGVFFITALRNLGFKSVVLSRLVSSCGKTNSCWGQFFILQSEQIISICKIMLLFKIQTRNAEQHEQQILLFIHISFARKLLTISNTLPCHVRTGWLCNLVHA